MLNKKSVWVTLFVSYLLLVATAGADGLKDFVLSKLDGKGTVDNITPGANTIVINDVTYTLSSNVTVFDVKNRRNSSIDNIKVGDSVGFKAKPLPQPTAPFDQLIIKLWILPS